MQNLCLHQTALIETVKYLNYNTFIVIYFSRNIYLYFSEETSDYSLNVHDRIKSHVLK